jgi:hypothetical protein
MLVLRRSPSHFVLRKYMYCACVQGLHGLGSSGCTAQAVTVVAVKPVAGPAQYM